MGSLSITLKDLRVFLKDRNTMLTTFLLPVLFILAFMGVANAAGSDDEEDNRIPLPVVNLDQDGRTGSEFIENLDQAGGVKTELYEEAEAEELLDEGTISRILFIPANFTDNVANGDQAQLRLVNDSDNLEETQSVMLVVEGVAREMSLQRRIIAGLEQLGQMQANNPDTQDAVSSEMAVAQARSQFESSKTRPLVVVEESISGQSAERDEIDLSQTQVLVPGWTVLFVFLTAQTTARSIYEEKKIGSFRRLLAAPITKGALLTGKLIPNFIVVILQVVFVFAVAMFIFPLLGIEALTLGDSPFALVILIIVVAISSTTLGITIVGIARTEGQISGLSTVILWIMAFLGGAIIPFYLLGGAFDTIGRVTPHYWALNAFNDLLVRGQNLGDIALPLVVLLGFSLLFFVIGLWRFEFE